MLVAVGLLALNLVLFLVLVNSVDFNVWWAQTTSVSVRTAVGFVLHQWFHFAGDTVSDAKTATRQSVAYNIQGVINIPVRAAVVTACVWMTGGWPLVGNVLSDSVLAVWVVFLCRFVVWRPESEDC